MKRKPAVAGQFYSAGASALSKQVAGFVKSGGAGEKAVGIVSPHAGLVYSGAVAGAVYSKIEFPNTFVLIGPNHTGLGMPVSVMTSGKWEMPTGSLEIDRVFAGKLLKRSEVFKEDSSAHLMEHSLEVQLPFIIYFSSDVRIVPVTMMTDTVDSCRLIGETVADVIKDTEYSVTIAASSDMTHYEKDSAARTKDKQALDRITALDPDGLYETVVKNDISMCGFAPVTAMLYAAQKLGAKKAELVKYMTSGEVSGDYDSVVGYAGIIVK